MLSRTIIKLNAVELYRFKVRQRIPFGFGGNGSIMFAVPPNRLRIVCAERNARKLTARPRSTATGGSAREERD